MSLYNEIKEIASITTTTNGDKAYSTTGSFTYDLIARAGGMRGQNEEFAKLFYLALMNDKKETLKALFFTRDIIDGIGERDLFRVGLIIVGNEFPELVSQVLPFVTKDGIGRFDDLLVLLDTKAKTIVLEYIKSLIEIKPVDSLLVKWLPSINTSSKSTVRYAKIIAEYIGWSDRTYRKFLSNNRNVVEQKLSAKKFTEIEYGKVPSQASLKYRNVFFRNDEEGYTKFLEKVANGSENLNTGTLQAHQVTTVASIESASDINDKFSNLAFERILNQLDDIDDRTIVVRDGSGSMTCGPGKIIPIDVANALTLACASKLTGDMHNAFITFSNKAKLVKIPEGLTLKQKLNYLNQLGDCSNTNIENVYNLVLTLARQTTDKNSIPKRLLIISDMQFDASNRSGYYGYNFGVPNESTLEVFKRDFAALGVDFPQIYFWNVNDNGTVPTFKDDGGVFAISGYSQKLLNAIAKNEKLDPVSFVSSLLEKYSFVDSFKL